MKERNQIRVATMTFHMAHNYGAMLQAYALQEAVCKLGYSCEVLDYRFPYIDQWSGIRTWKDLRQETGFLWGTLRWIRRLYSGYYRRQTAAQKKFNNFMRGKFRLSHRVYFDANELRNADYNAIFFGSDQIWNPALTNGIASEYFGDFVDTDKTKLIAYAASCGKSSLPAEYEDALLPMIRRFHALGIREDGFTQWLREVHGLPAQTVLDPVFLLKKQDWDALLKDTPRTIEEPYLLVYAFDAEDEIYNLARRIAGEKKLRLVSVCYKPNKNLKDILQLTDCGPLEFLRLLRNASFVCTTSFHGEAFSIIFEKDFYCIGHPIYAQRNSDLLKLLGLQDRMISKAEGVQQILPCEYTEANYCLDKFRNEAMEFIVNAIEG